MYNKLIHVINYFNERDLKVHGQSINTDTFKSYLVNKNNEIYPSKSVKDNFLIGIWMLNYLTVCGYLNVVDVSNIGRNRRYFIKNIDFSKVNEFKLYTDLIESMTYGKTLLHERSFGGDKSKNMILSKFKSIYFVNKLPRTGQESIDLLNKYFSDSNTVSNISLYNDIYGKISVSDLESKKSMDSIKLKISKFNKMYYTDSKEIKYTDKLMQKMKYNCSKYDFIGTSDKVTDYTEFFDAIEFYIGYFSDMNELNEFIKSSKDLIHKLKSRVNHDIKDYDKIVMYNRSLITDKDLLESFKNKNTKLIKMIGN